MNQHRSEWVRWLEQMARPVLESFANEQMHQQMPFERHPKLETNRQATSRLEAVGRLLAGIAPWLETEQLNPHEELLRKEFARWAIQGLAQGFNPKSPDYLNFNKHQQAVVDSAYIVQAFLRAPNVLWKSLDETTHKRVIHTIQTLRARLPYFNNWLLFAAVMEAFLISIQRVHDPMRLDYALRQHEHWYLGDGVYGDGPEFHADYYNSYVIQPMQWDILEQSKKVHPFAKTLYSAAIPRLARWAEIQERQIHVDGSWPILGRSITY